MFEHLKMFLYFALINNAVGTYFVLHPCECVQVTPRAVALDINSLHTRRARSLLL